MELADCEATLLREIADAAFTRDQIARTYALAIRSSEARTINWAAVNNAIIARWSLAALEFIKCRAWSGACFKEGRK